ALLHECHLRPKVTRRREGKEVAMQLLRKEAEIPEAEHRLAVAAELGRVEIREMVEDAAAQNAVRRDPALLRHPPIPSFDAELAVEHHDPDIDHVDDLRLQHQNDSR